MFEKLRMIMNIILGRPVCYRMENEFYQFGTTDGEISKNTTNNSYTVYKFAITDE